jgi:hypothetical protein
LLPARGAGARARAAGAAAAADVSASEDSPLDDRALRLVEAAALVPAGGVGHVDRELGLDRDVVLERDVVDLWSFVAAFGGERARRRRGARGVECFGGGARRRPPRSDAREGRGERLVGLRRSAER